MKLPNGYGAVIKLSGKRRKAWAIRKTIAWEVTKDGKKKQKYQYVGYYQTKKEALEALAMYNNEPKVLKSITFGELFNLWYDEHSSQVTDKTAKHYTLVYKTFENLKDKPIIELKLDDYQRAFKNSGKHTSALKSYRNIIHMMYDYAFKHEMISLEKKEMILYINVKVNGDGQTIKRTAFTKEEINAIWKLKDSYDAKVVLILLYTGVRISELLELEKSNVNLNKKYFHIKKAKTKAGIRDVPIADKIFPFFEDLMQKRGDYFITQYNGSKYSYSPFYNNHWCKIMEKTNQYHRIHDTRHTFITMLTEKDVDEKIIKTIVGHKGSGVTQVVYTHIGMDKKLEAVNKL